jgi:hypothetical protein
MLIAAVEAPWAESVVMEAIARKQIDIPTDDLDDVLSFRWNRPPKHYPDPVKEETAAALAMMRGKSPSSVAEELGDDFEHEVLQSHQDTEFAKIYGVEVGGAEAASNASAEPDGDEEDAEDSEDGEPVAAGADKEGAE